MTSTDPAPHATSVMAEASVPKGHDRRYELSEGDWPIFEGILDMATKYTEPDDPSEAIRILKGHLEDATINNKGVLTDDATDLLRLITAGACLGGAGVNDETSEILKGVLPHEDGRTSADEMYIEDVLGQIVHIKARYESGEQGVEDLLRDSGEEELKTLASKGDTLRFAQVAALLTGALLSVGSRASVFKDDLGLALSGDFREA